MFLVLETFENMWATRNDCFRNKNVSEFLGKHFCFLGSKFCFRNNVSRGGQTEKHYLLIGNIMFPITPFSLEYIREDT